jgi:hypothetical protein
MRIRTNKKHSADGEKRCGGDKTAGRQVVRSYLCQQELHSADRTSNRHVTNKVIFQKV